MTSPRRLVPAAALAGLGLLAGCGSGSSGGSPAGAASTGTTVTAIETDYHIALSRPATKPGTYTFVVENQGQAVHALEITGPGLSHAATPDIPHGETKRLTVTLGPGSYDVFCPVANHRMLGMDVPLTVS